MFFYGETKEDNRLEALLLKLLVWLISVRKAISSPN